MKPKFTFIFLIIFSLVFAQKQRKVVFVIADGIPYDHILTHKMPNLQKLAKTGGISEAYVGGEKNGYTETPTISAVGYNSLLTGTWVNKHNVYDNENEHQNYNYWNVFRFFKTQFPEKKIGIFSTWEDNRTKLIGQNYAEAGNLKPDYIFDGYEKDEKTFPHDEKGHFYNKIDDFVMEKATETIKKSAPDLSWIYLEYTDEMGHQFGDGKEFDHALDELDKRIGKLDEAVKFREKNFNEEWLVIITTDHGRDIEGFHHGSQTNRERNTWIATNYAEMNKYFKVQQPGIIDITPTILRFLDVKVPQEKQFEIDGIPLIGKVSAIDLNAKLKDNQLEIFWIPIERVGDANIYISSTNNFKNGGKDEYQLIKKIAVDDWHTTIDVSKMPSNFYKIVLEMPYNTINRWVFVK